MSLNMQEIYWEKCLWRRQGEEAGDGREGLQTIMQVGHLCKGKQKEEFGRKSQQSPRAQRCLLEAACVKQEEPAPYPHHCAQPLAGGTNREMGSRALTRAVRQFCTPAGFPAGELSGALPCRHRDIDLWYWILCWFEIKFTSPVVLILFSIPFVSVKKKQTEKSWQLSLDTGHLCTLMSLVRTKVRTPDSISFGSAMLWISHFS